MTHQVKDLFGQLENLARSTDEGRVAVRDAKKRATEFGADMANLIHTTGDWDKQRNVLCEYANAHLRAQGVEGYSIVPSAKSDGVWTSQMTQECTPDAWALGDIVFKSIKNNFTRYIARPLYEANGMLGLRERGKAKFDPAKEAAKIHKAFSAAQCKQIKALL